jgi:hypothetical protein
MNFTSKKRYISTAQSYMTPIFKRVSSGLKVLRIFFNGIGVAAIALGQAWQVSEIDWQVAASSYIFWSGLLLIIVSAISLLFTERDDVTLIVALIDAETDISDLKSRVDYIEAREKFFRASQSANKILSELLDQAILHSQVSEEFRTKIFDSAVECISQYREELFGIGSEYCNISIYGLNQGTGLLDCISCFRSVPSDAIGPHRSWGIGEGHVGKAFQLKRELICADALQPDIRPWISAPPGKVDTDDEERYVSLAAVPLGLNFDEPFGVLIITSSIALRFGNSDDNRNGDDAAEIRRLRTAVVQDFATQISQMMAILGPNQAEPAEEREHE